MRLDGLPDENTPWPEAAWAPAFEQFRVNRAWWAADVDALATFYTAEGQGNTRGDSDAMHFNKSTGVMHQGGLKSKLLSWWSGRPVAPGLSGRSTRLPSLLAGNIANLSADVLTSEPPMVRLMVNGKPVKGGLQDRVDDLANEADTHIVLSQAAELTAGLSGSVLVANWDRANTDKPFSSVVNCDAVIPIYVGQRLDAVVMWTTHEQKTMTGVTTAVFYHVERHESGRILHALYKGTASSIGTLVPLDSIDATRHIPAIFGALAGDDERGHTRILLTGIKTITASYWRNRPTKTFDGVPDLAWLGRSDTEGAESYLDAHSMVWSSWMRDIKLARARLIVPESFLSLNEPGTGGIFDDDQEVLTPLNFVELDGDDSKITAQQFEIRATQHAESIQAINREVLQHAGWSNSTYGDSTGGEGSSKTATEIVDRTTLTERTSDKKALYFDKAYELHLRAKLELDAFHYAGKNLPADANIDIVHAPVSQMDPEKQARIIGGLRTAMVATTKTLVAMLHPEWEAEQIDREVIEIQTENGMGPEADPNASVDENGDPIPLLEDPNQDPEKIDQSDPANQPKA